MPIDVRCPSCTTRMAVPERLAGKRIRCKSCKEEIRVEVPESLLPEPDEAAAADKPRKKKKKRPEPIPRAVLLSVGGVVLLGVLIIATVAVIHLMRPRPKLGPGIGQPVEQTAVFAEHIFRPARQPKDAGRPAEPVEGPVVVTLSNPRRVGGGDRPTYQIDYAFADGPPADGDQLDLVAKVPKGVSELRLPRLPEAKGTLSFTFYPGEDPGGAFDLWVERRLPGRANNRQRVSPVVTVPAPAPPPAPGPMP